MANDDKLKLIMPKWLQCMGICHLVMEYIPYECNELMRFDDDDDDDNWLVSIYARQER